MKILVVTLLALLGFYWLFVHSYPLPFSHDSFGLHNHDIHRMIGIVFFVSAGLVWWKWHPGRG